MKRIQKEEKNLVLPAQTEGKYAKAVVKYLRISPRKVRLVINAIRHQPATRAFHVLMTLKKKAARMTEKALKTAVANAKILGMDENRLYVADIRADGGPVFKRFMSRSMGRADRILKRTTHLSLIVKEGAKTFEAPSETQAKEGRAKDRHEEKTKPGRQERQLKKKLAAAGAAKS